MKPITEKEFSQLVYFIRTEYGINLFHKKALVVGRLQNYIMQSGFKSFSEYYESVLADKTGNAASVLINKMTTNHTFFMRESEHFDYLQRGVLPRLEFEDIIKKDLRIWSAGCSTGEEAYTLAMIIDEYFGEDKGFLDTKILATDISTRVLETAVGGIYSREEIASLPDKWKRNYFTQVNEENSMIIDRIKNEVIFKRFNLMEKVFPFQRKFHIIFCRNVMIYFDQKTKNELADKFYESMERGGHLFIGHSESLNREETKFKYVKPAIYRKD